MTQMALGESLLLIVGAGLIAGLSYWLGLKNAEVTHLSFSIELPKQQSTVTCADCKRSGRGIAELKHCDVIMTDDGPIMVMRPTSIVPYRGKMITVDELYARGKIEGVYPVESYIKFEDGDSNA